LKPIDDVVQPGNGLPSSRRPYLVTTSPVKYPIVRPCSMTAATTGSAPCVHRTNSIHSRVWKTTRSGKASSSPVDRVEIEPLELHVRWLPRVTTA